MSSLARLGGAFVFPIATFTDIAREPRFGLALILQCLVATLFGVVELAKIGAENMVNSGLAVKLKMQPLPPEQLPKLQLFAHQTAAAMRTGVYFTPAVVILLLCVVSACFFAGIRLMLGKEGVTFKRTFSMVVHAHLPQALLKLLLIGTIFLASNPTRLNPPDMIGTSLAFYLDPQRVGRSFYTPGTHLNLFSVWVVVLLGIGTAKLAGSKKLSTGLGLAFGLWALWLLIKVGITAI